MKKIKVKLTFVEPVLGTWPSNQNIAREFIASKSPDAATVEDEVAALGADAVADKGMTVFPRNEKGEPVLYDYQVKGFFKDSCGVPQRNGKERLRHAENDKGGELKWKAQPWHGEGKATSRAETHRYAKAKKSNCNAKKFIYA